MAQTGLKRPETGKSAEGGELLAERARQGQNIKGMIWVLLISMGLLIAAYLVMLAVQQEPVRQDHRPANFAALAHAPGAPQTAMQETAQSPPR